MGEPFDRVYMSKIFSFTPDYPYYVNAKEVHKGGSGYCHVSMKVGFCSYKVADMDTLWKDQKNIVFLDTNITVCKKWRPLFQLRVKIGVQNWQG